MASGGQERGKVPGYDHYDECPVCLECLKDPRTLNCGHFFCRVCIEGLVRANPQRPIKCPTCREVTQLPRGSGVGDLPQYERKYSFQDQVTDFLSRAKFQVTRSCDICQDKKVTATFHCFRCRKNLCNDCGQKHEQKAPTHKTVPMSEDMFCTTHVNEVVVELCQVCNKGICGDCLFEGHEDHQSVDIKHMAKEGRFRLKEFLKIQSTLDVDDVTVKSIHSHLDQFNDSIAQTKKRLKELETKLNHLERDTNDKVAAGLKTLSLYDADFKDMTTSRQRLVNHATYLVDKASDQELVEHVKHFPINNENVLQNIEDVGIEMPALIKTLVCLSTQLQQLISACEVISGKKKIGTFRDIEDLRKQNKVAVGYHVGGITVDSARQRFVARTNDASGPVKVYDYQGQLQESVGVGVTGLADCENWRSICIDTKRDCYVAPCYFELLLVNRAGHKRKSISVGCSNRGVAYHKDSDCYLVSDFHKHTVYLIDANTSLVTREIGPPGSGPTQFKEPYDIHVGNVTNIGSPCIIVSDHGTKSVNLFDIFGRNMKTYGGRGEGDSQLSGPVGVTTDPQGQVIVCDCDNYRVTAFSTDGGKDQYTCLLHNDWGGHQPWRLALDTDNMVLAIVDNTRNTFYIYK